MLLSILIFFGLNLTLGLPAQENENKKPKVKLEKLYYRFGLGKTLNLYPTSSGTLGSHALVIGFSNNWGGTIEGASSFVTPVELPFNYSPGFPFGLPPRYPKDHLFALSAKVSRDFPQSSPYLLFGLEGGVSLVRQVTLHFIPNPNPGWFGSNYNTIASVKYSGGISLRGKMAIPVSRVFGFELGLSSNLNPYQTFFGADIHLAIGLLRGMIVNSGK